MKTDHRVPLQEFGYAVLPDWQPAPKLPAIVRVGLILAGSLVGWTVGVLFALAVRAVW